MWTTFLAIVEILKALISFWYSYVNFSELNRALEVEKKRNALELAIAKMKAAKTEQEADDAQDSIVDNMP